MFEVLVKKQTELSEFKLQTLPKLDQVLNKKI